MAKPLVFIGVVSYKGSRFPHSQGESGLGAQLRAALCSRGIETDLVVDMENRWDECDEPITREQIQRALTDQARLEDAWEKYLRTGHFRGGIQLAHSLARWARRAYRYVRTPSPAIIRRLINIELAHTALLAQGVASGAAWIVILEDDAQSPDVIELADGMAGLVNHCPTSIQFVNLSESFDLQELGVSDLFEWGTMTWEGAQRRSIGSPQRPITNTVCAIAYRSEFVSRLLAEFALLPLHPVVPIDWKLNRAIMHMNELGELGPDSCAWVVPGPIDQMSMRTVP